MQNFVELKLSTPHGTLGTFRIEKELPTITPNFQLHTVH